MARYFFHFEAGGTISADNDGYEFPSVELAKEEAAAIVSEVSRNKTPAELNGLFLTLSDEDGALICRIAIARSHT